MAVDKIKEERGSGKIIVTPEDIANLKQYSSISESLIEKIAEGQGTVTLIKEDFKQIKDFFDFFDRDLEDTRRTLREIKDDIGEGKSSFRELTSLSSKLTASYQGLRNLTEKPGGAGLTDLNRELLNARRNLRTVREEVADITKKWQKEAGVISGDSSETIKNKIGNKLSSLIDEAKEAARTAKNNAESARGSARTKYWENYRESRRKLRELMAEQDLYTVALSKAIFLEQKAADSLESWVAGGKKLGGTVAIVTGLAKAISKIPGLEGVGQNLSERLFSVRNRIGSKTNPLSASEGRQELWKSVQDSVGESTKLLFSWGTAIGLAWKAAIKVWNTLKEVSNSTAELTRRVGDWNYKVAAANTEFASSVDFIKVMVDLADRTGLAVNAIFSSDAVASAAEFKNLTGATADQASNLVVRSKLVNQTTDQYRESLRRGFVEGNNLNHSAVTLREVQKGVLEASDATALSYGNNAQALGKAVVAAKNLGLELAGVEKMSQSLINFESSIEAEMQAQLLTGKQLSLVKAREYALWNDLEGVAEEVKRQGVTAADFTKMNVIQQENMAKALGLSREELAKSLILRELNNGLTAEQVSRLTGVKLEEIEAVGITERWRIATDKLKQSFIIVLEAVEPVVKILADAISWIAGKSAQAGFGTIAVGILLVGLTLKPIISLLGALFKGIAVGVGGASKAFKGLAGAILHPKRALESIKAAFGASSTGSGKNLRVLGTDLKRFYAEMRSVRMSDILKVAAMGPLMTIAAPGIALLSLVSMIPSKGLEPLGRGLGSFFRTLGKAAQNPYTWLGIGLIAAVGAALIPLGIAIGKVAPTIEALGKLLGTVITSTFEGITSTLVTLAQVLGGLSVADIGKLALLGGSLVVFSASLLGSIPGLLTFGLLGLPILTGVSIALKRLSDSSNGLRSLATGISGLVTPLKELLGVLQDFDKNTLNALNNLGLSINTSESSEGKISKAEGNVRRQERRLIAQGNRVKDDGNKLTSTEKIETLLKSIDTTLKTGKTISIDYDRLNRGLQIYTVG